MIRSGRLSAVLVTAALATASSGSVVAVRAAAAPEAPAHVIVSMNVNGALHRHHDDLRPQTWQASLDGTPSLQHGIGVVWAGERFRVSVGPGDGDALHPGLSHTPQLALDNADTHLGGTAALDDEDFSSFDGQADLVDVAVDASGTITRFDLVYAFTQERALGAVFGEIRMNEPEQLPTLSPTAQQLVWPRVGLENDPVLATDAFRNTSGAPLPLGTASITGADRDYLINDDTCSGTVLAPSATCSITVAYRPVKGGPRLATLVVPTAADRLQVQLASKAPLGRSSITTTGDEYVDHGKHTTFDPIVVYGHGDGDGGPALAYQFVRDELSPQIQASPEDEFALDLSNERGTITQGTHKTHWTARQYGLTYHANYRYCDDLSGTVDVHHFVLDQDDQPTYVDVDFDQRCHRNLEHTGTIHGRLRYQDRSDATAPGRPTKLRLEDGRLRWKRSSSKDLASTVVRVDLGKRFDPTRGVFVSQGSAQSAVLPRLTSGSTYTVAAFSVDKTGNVSKPTTLKVST